MNVMNLKKKQDNINIHFISMGQTYTPWFDQFILLFNFQGSYTLLELFQGMFKNF